MNLVESALQEMPVAHFQTVGNFDKPHSFRSETDRKLLTNPKSVAKMHRKLANNRFDFNFFFVNMPGAGKFLETGRVEEKWLEENMPKAWVEIKPNVNPNSINVIYTNNTGTARVPLTAWMIAHRLGHALFRERGYFTRGLWEDVERILTETASHILEIYGKRIPPGKAIWLYRQPELGILRSFFQQIGTMKSARDRALPRPFEFAYELLAQFLITGGVKFNPLKEYLIVGTAGWGRPQYAHAHAGDVEYANSVLRQLAESLDEHFDDMLSKVIGSIYVM